MIIAAVSSLGTATLIGIGAGLIAIVTLLALSIRVVRPTHRGLVERLGKYHHYSDPGFHLIIPFVDRMFRVDVREVLVEAQPQEIITNDNLNAKVDAQVYLKVRADEENVKASQYNVTNYENQVVNLARTTLRNIIGTLSLKSANSERGKINDALRSTLKAENEKIAAVDFATATETQADGARRAEIKKAEGIRQAKILAAEGEAQAIKLVNEAAEQYFVGNAQVLRKLEAVERSLYQNTKVVVPANGELVNIIGDLAGVVPLPGRGSGKSGAGHDEAARERRPAEAA